ncbi:MAG TPA: glycoside hydrolase family 3 C-terminal domain-containing protein [Flavisolibacter sp.]
MKKRMIRMTLVLLLISAVTGNEKAAAQAAPSDAIIYKKIDAQMAQMTLEEKISMLHANGIFTTAGVPRLRIPGLSTDDGPLGVREDLSPAGGWASANLTTDSATFFPNGSALAATWNPSLLHRYGVALGEESRARGKDMILAPAFNITRTPLNGRTYEYLSEDPFLNAQLAVAAVKGIQSQGVAACVKHYAVNNQETNRSRVNVELSERALREIYLPAFKASIEEGDAWSVMSAYNKVRGEWCAENTYLLQTILKGEWRFKGLVISDWGGTHSTVASANRGLDVEMGSRPPYESYYFARPLLDSVKAGKVSQAVIDDKVRRILWVLYKTSLNAARPVGSINTPEHSQTVYDIAAEAIVLLKNEKGLLPLKTAGIKRIAVIGDNATHTFHSGGFGAGVKARYEITALQGLKNKLGKTVDIQFAQGYQARRTNRRNRDSVDVNKPDAALIAEAVATAKASEAAILFVGGNRDYESESWDRKDLTLPFGEQALVDAVTAANANTIVVVVGGAPYDLAAIKKANHTIVFSWYNGSEGGNALADVLTGKINPSGKLPFTFPVRLEESPAHALHTFPGDSLTAVYKEDLLVGYRWNDTKKIEPLYPFGYGLSYTTFSYTNMVVVPGKQSAMVTLTITNTGKVAGAEVVQLYIKDDVSTLQRPEKELKGFEKVFLKPGESKKVTIALGKDAFQYYNDIKGQWVLEPGAFTIMAGSSSKDIRATKTIQMK